MGDNTWQARAACAGHDEPDLFHPTPGGMTKDKAQQIRDAKTVCGGCPVRAECLREAVENQFEGIWGGTTDAERYGMRPRNGQAPRRTKEPTPSDRCGTYSGAQRHRKRREGFCGPCRDARNGYENDRKRRAREAARLEDAS